MMLDGYTIADKKIVVFDETFPEAEQIQPNGVDLRVEKLYQVQGQATIHREAKAFANFQVDELTPKDGYWTLNPHNNYFVDFFEKVSIPGGFCGIIQTRSSLVRAGLDVMSGIYDSGFQGQAGGVLRVYSRIQIEYGARLAQMTIIESKFRGHLYQGRYQNSNSQTAITNT